MPSQAAVEKATAFTWADYRAWRGDERWELIDGAAHAMSPAPSIRHQTVVGNLFARIEQHLRGQPCRPFVAPTDVKLSEQDVVQPDILVVCNAGMITETHIDGAPDLIVEVLSPGSAARDLRQKKALYERADVREYLLIDPLEHYALRFLLGADGFDRGTVIAADEPLTFATLDELAIPLWEILDLPTPDPVAPAPDG
ncbi:MAG: Uma2 family endonuclease [Thiohalocapsa sp. PB-PSB1]|jgi:Uma2 family endonuclease|nr:MAG: Uma2 family endonuclease [Thiohalocapsa sp. PB-PSB1]HCS89867.1 Uma2 family endonuclease [Chromatiaceae bacterium]